MGAWAASLALAPPKVSAARNSFVAKADGTASVTVNAPEILTSANAVLLVYHSDGKTYGTSRGDIGVTAHHQLIAKVE